MTSRWSSIPWCVVEFVTSYVDARLLSFNVDASFETKTMCCCWANISQSLHPRALMPVLLLLDRASHIICQDVCTTSIYPLPTLLGRKKYKALSVCLSATPFALNVHSALNTRSTLKQKTPRKWQKSAAQRARQPRDCRNQPRTDTTTYGHTGLSFYIYRDWCSVGESSSFGFPMRSGFITSTHIFIFATSRYIMTEIMNILHIVHLSLAWRARLRRIESVLPSVLSPTRLSGYFLSRTSGDETDPIWKKSFSLNV